MTIIGTIYNSSMFTYNPETKVFSADISEVPKVLRELWNDSMDLGFGICSKVTGNTGYFTLYELIRDADDDVVRWVFVPTTRSLREIPQLNDVKVYIFND